MISLPHALFSSGKGVNTYNDDTIVFLTWTTPKQDLEPWFICEQENLVITADPNLMHDC